MEKTISFGSSILVTNVGDNVRVTHLGELYPDVQIVTNITRYIGVVSKK